jgi:biopolymer transport protein ExbB/TolQ
VSLPCNVSRRAEQMIELGLWLLVAVGLWTLAEQATTFGLIDVWRWMSSVSRGVILVLAVMVLHTVSITGDRLVTFGRARRQSRVFVRQSSPVGIQHPEKVLALAKRYPQSHVAKVVASGLIHISQSPSWLSRPDEIECCKGSMRRANSMTHSELQYGLATLATIASLAPFIGLFGTLFGILNSFGRMTGQVDAVRAYVAGGLSDALLTTAMGLLVAVPAAWSHNFFRDWLSVLQIEMENASSELVGYLSRRDWRVPAESVGDVSGEAGMLSLTPDHDGNHSWEVSADSQVVLLLPVWLSWLCFAYVIAEGVYWSTLP